VGDALRNLELYRQQGDSGQFGPSIQFDTNGVEFGPWISRFVAQVKRNWLIPSQAMSMRGHVVVTFNVHKDGSITDIVVRAPSAVDAFDSAAQGAISGTNRTQPLPPQYPAEKAFFTVTFYYNEAPPPGERAVQANAPALPVPDRPLLDAPASLLLKASAEEVEQRIGQPSQIDGRRWTYRTPHGALAVYFDDAHVVVDVQPRAFDLSFFKK